MLAQDSFLGSLLDFASGVVEWKLLDGKTQQQSNTQKQGGTYGYPNWLFWVSALHRSQSLTNSTQQVRFCLVFNI